MVEVEITWGRVTKVWWSLLWRGLLFGMLAGFIPGFIIGLIGGIARIDAAIIKPMCMLAGVLFGIPVGLWVVKKILQKNFGEFRIALLSNTP